MRESVKPWSVPIAVADIPEAGLRIELTADDATRTAVAAVAGVNGVTRLEASFDLAPHGRDAVHVVGTVSAQVAQTCVVTLESIVNEIVEAVDLMFVPRAKVSGGEAGGLDPTGAEAEPEALVDGVVDLGVVATEFLILGVDPYPRKPGAVFDAPREPDDGDSPFAALAALKRGERGPRD